MSTSPFVKGECRQCGGHLEFPAEAAGETIPCPHCGQPTELVAANSLNKSAGPFRTLFLAGIGVCIVAAGLAVVFLRHPATPAPVVETGGRLALPANSLAAATNSPATRSHPAVESLTNEFALLPYQLEKTPGSSLVYVTGTLRNASSRQRFGVKIEFALLDLNSNAVGKATDYQPVLDPHGEWHFKALVMESKTAAARFTSVAEDQ
jgi:hypothetical protein